MKSPDKVEEVLVGETDEEADHAEAHENRMGFVAALEVELGGCGDLQSLLSIHLHEQDRLSVVEVVAEQTDRPIGHPEVRLHRSDKLEDVHPVVQEHYVDLAGHWQCHSSRVEDAL